MFRTRKLVLITLFCCGCSTGTEQTTTLKLPAIDEDAPKSLKESAALLVQMRNTIQQGFAANDVDAAHGPLHEIGDVLKHMPELAEEDGIAGDDLEMLVSAVNDLMEAFDAVDKTLHGGDGSTYDEEQEKIDAAVQILTDLSGVENVTIAAPPVDPNGGPEISPEIQEPETLNPIDVTEPTSE